MLFELLCGGVLVAHPFRAGMLVYLMDPTLKGRATAEHRFALTPQNIKEQKKSNLLK